MPFCTCPEDSDSGPSDSEVEAEFVRLRELEKRHKTLKTSLERKRRQASRPRLREQILQTKASLMNMQQARLGQPVNQSDAGSSFVSVDEMPPTQSTKLNPREKMLQHTWLEIQSEIDQLEHRRAAMHRAVQDTLALSTPKSAQTPASRHALGRRPSTPCCAALSRRSPVAASPPCVAPPAVFVTTLAQGQAARDVAARLGVLPPVRTSRSAAPPHVATIQAGPATAAVVRVERAGFLLYLSPAAANSQRQALNAMLQSYDQNLLDSDTSMSSSHMPIATKPWSPVRPMPHSPIRPEQNAGSTDVGLFRSPPKVAEVVERNGQASPSWQRPAPIHKQPLIQPWGLGSPRIGPSGTFGDPPAIHSRSNSAGPTVRSRRSLMPTGHNHVKTRSRTPTHFVNPSAGMPTDVVHHRLNARREADIAEIQRKAEREAVLSTFWKGRF
eukprot:gene6559-1169_t